VRAEVVAVLEVELVLAALLDGHGEDDALLLRAPSQVRAELLVDQHAGRVSRSALVETPEESLEDDRLCIRDALSVFRAGCALDAQHLLLE
jgi:hypothetical protein